MPSPSNATLKLIRSPQGGIKRGDAEVAEKISRTLRLAPETRRRPGRSRRGRRTFEKAIATLDRQRGNDVDCLQSSMPDKTRYQNRIELLQGTLDMLILQTLQWGSQ